MAEEAGPHRRLDESGLEQLLAGLTAVRGGNFGIRLAKTGDPLLDEIAAVFNGMADQLDLFTSEVTRMAREVGTEGKLGGQARVPGVSGTWQDLTDSVNGMAANLTAQVRNISQVATAVAGGDLSQKILVDARGEVLELKQTINTMVDQLSSFADEVTRVAREVGREGRLGGQAEVEGVSGTWKRLTQNVNELAGNLTRQVRAIAEVASAVAAGDLTRSISVEARGEVAELKDNINAMVGSLRETTEANQEQDWLKTNLARITGMMQGHRDPAVVADLIMDELAPLVGAQHGTFFLAERADDGETRLRLIAGYGLPADQEAPVQYRIGQSLIGQVAKSRRPIVIADIPEGYIKICSGLGDAPPASLAILPILFEDRVLGVIELASFTKFGRVQRDFLERLTETLGVTVNTLMVDARTDSLLTELEERARQLALASEYKSQFLANMSHELRTPLNTVLILARLLAQNSGGNLTAKQVEYASVIHSAGSDLLQLIDDILDLSKVEAGRMDVHAEPFDLAALLGDVKATFQPLAAEKRLGFAVEAEPGIPQELLTDRQRLRRVLGNLLSNAVKFTERGRVTLRVGMADRPASDGGAMLAFSVADTGIGVAPENLAAIFGAFQQGDDALSHRYGGTGLGLSIAREVAALLGGQITADSEPGRGSTFTMYLPRELPGAAAGPRTSAEEPADGEVWAWAPGPPAVPGGALPGRRVLVVEGQASGLLTLLAHAAVSDLGGMREPVQVTTAADAEEGIRALRAAPCQCVVVDLGQPDAGAFAFLERLQESPDLRAVPVLGYARDNPDGARAQVARLGLRSMEPELVSSPDELRVRITLRLSAGQRGHGFAPAGGQQDDAPAGRAARHEALSGRKVLVIDDDPRNVFAITSALEEQGMTVTHAPDGRLGIAALLAGDDPDIVLMDVMMPELDGNAAMSMLRQIPAFAALPIIAVTARAMPGDRDKSVAAGASDYVKKPVDTDELLSCMERWLGDH